MNKLINGIVSFFNVRARDIYKTRFVVDHARDNYIKTCDSIQKMKKNLIDAKAQKAVLNKKHDNISLEILEAKEALKNLASTKGKIDPIKFKQLKTTFDAKTEQREFIDKSRTSLASMIEKLEAGVAKSQSIKQQLEYKIQTLTQKQEIIKTMGTLNEAMIQLDPDMTTDQLETEQIDDDAEKEIAKFEALSSMQDQKEADPTTDAEMKEFIKSL